MDIRNVYHTHTDASGNSYSDNTTLTQLDNPGGCFKAKGHTHNEQCGKPQRNLLVITVDNIGMATGAVLVAVLVRDQGRAEELYIRPATPVDHLSILGF